MKHTALRFLLLLSLAITAASAFPAGKKEPAQEQTYSPATVILWLEHGTDDDAIDALARKYDMTVIYRYRSFSSCAMRLSEPLGEEAFSRLIAQLEQEPCVLSAQRDAIMTLD